MIMFHKRSYDDVIVCSDTCFASKLYTFVARPSYLAFVALVFYKGMLADVHH